jgi:hypothetical protein
VGAHEAVGGGAEGDAVGRRVTAKLGQLDAAESRNPLAHIMPTRRKAAVEGRVVMAGEIGRVNPITDVERRSVGGEAVATKAPGDRGEAARVEVKTRASCRGDDGKVSIHDCSVEAGEDGGGRARRESAEEVTETRVDAEAE